MFQEDAVEKSTNAGRLVQAATDTDLGEARYGREAGGVSRNSANPASPLTEAACPSSADRTYMEDREYPKEALVCPAQKILQGLLTRRFRVETCLEVRRDTLQGITSVQPNPAVRLSSTQHGSR
jgi:hypothetical protein